MSAFMVPVEHVRAMVNAGLRTEGYGPLSWSVRQLTQVEKDRAYEPGQPWGPDMHAVIKETHRELTRETAGAVGAMLLAQNRRSVDFRYNESDIEEPYLHAVSTTPREPVEILKAIDCYEYQSCETPDWEDSEAARFCQALRALLIGKLPGYAEADAWPLEEA